MKTLIHREQNIGPKIRTKRKEKGMTLGELANGVCSVGKMSNIENGRIPIFDEDLILISEKLGVSVHHFSDPTIETKIQEADFMRRKIQDLIGLRKWDAASYELQIFKRKIEEYNLESQEIDWAFLAGSIHLQTNQPLEAEVYFKQVIETEGMNKRILRLKLRAFNALASIYFSQKKTLKSSQLLEKALQLSNDHPTTTKIERDNIFYNLSILNLYLGSYQIALQKANSVNHHLIPPVDTEYIKLMIRLMEDSSNPDIRKDVIVFREKLQRMNDQEGIIRSWALGLNILLMSLPEEALTEVAAEFFLVNVEVPELRIATISLLQHAIHLFIVRKLDMTLIQQLMDKTKLLLPFINQSFIQARNLYLEGKLQKEILMDESAALTLFEQAINTLDSHYYGLLRAELLFEICRLKNVGKDALKALELYHGHFESQVFFSHYDDLFFPPFKF